MNVHRSDFFTKFGLMLTFLLALLATSAQAQQAGFAERFEDPELPGWDHSPGVVVENGVLHIEPGNFAFRPGEWGNYVEIAATLRWEGDGEFVLSYQASSGSGYHLVVGRNYLVSQREFEGTLSELNSVSNQPVPSGWFLILIRLEGDRHQFFLNGVLVLESSDSEPLPPGGVGLEPLGDVTLEADELILASEDAAPPKEEQEPPALDGELSWVRTGGPLGGLGYDVRMNPENPEIMFVTDAFAGVFKSTDGGETWFPSNNGINVRGGASGDAIPIFCLTIDPNNPDTVWVGTQNVRGIFKSEDGGETWVMKVNGILEREGITFRGISIDPQDSLTVYAAAEISSWAWANSEQLGREFDKTKGVVYKTTNGGESWTPVWRGDNLARYILIDPRDTDVLYVSTGIFDREAANSDHTTNTPGGVGVLKSIDGGQTWQQVNNGITNLYVGTLFMHPNNPDILLAGTGNNAYLEGAGVFLTTDAGESWKRVLAEGVQSVEFAVSDPDIAYAGNPGFIFRSTDGGSTWESTVRQSEENIGWGPDGVEAGFPIDFQVDPDDAERIFANNYGGGNFLSEDGGASWVIASDGYTGAQVRSVAVSPREPGQVFAAARSGIFGSYDGGGKWVGLNFPQASGLEWNAVAFDPSAPDHVLAANNWSGGIFESKDGGLSWQLTDILWTNMQGWRTIAFAPADSIIVYAGAGAFGSAGSFNNELPASGIYRSMDGGTSWAPANDSLTRDAQITSLAVHPSDPQVVYATSPANGIFKTSDGGTSWRWLGTFPPQARPLSVAIHPTQPDIVLLGMEFGGLYRSEDGGDTWKAVAAGLPPESSITSIVFNPVDPDQVYFGDHFSGFYRSTDGGQTWLVTNTGLRTRAINQLAISTDGMHLYAATEGEGIFRLDLNGQPPASAAPPEKLAETGATESAPMTEGSEVLSDEIAAQQPTETPLIEETPPDSQDLGIAFVIGAVAVFGVAVLIFLVVRRSPKNR